MKPGATELKPSDSLDAGAALLMHIHDLWRRASGLKLWHYRKRRIGPLFYQFTPLAPDQVWCEP
jgi:hypothetical protein